ncbi:MAG: nucleoside phosphorylase [Flavobacteriales bacterium]|nr:nucleoside phosphorylase [Flavobacteriales bacterium]
MSMKSSISEIKGVYHLNLLAEHVANDIFLVGDQGRVSEISKRFDSIEYKISNREFTTHTGYIGNKRVSALSTGIGTDNIDIVLNELDSLVPKDVSLNLIRLGTSGTIQKDIDIHSLVVSTHGLGIDNLMHFYADNQFDEDLQIAIDKQLKWPKELSNPYIYAADNELLSKFKDLKSGITVTAPGFYAPQGRKLRLPFAIEDLHDRLKSFEHNGLRVTNFEMETSALYGLGKLMGHKCLTICTILANRATGEKSTYYKSAIDNMIDTVIAKLY